MPRPTHLPPPTIPLDEGIAVEEHASYIPSNLMEPLLDFQMDRVSPLPTSVIHCIRMKLTEAYPAHLWVSRRYDDYLELESGRRRVTITIPHDAQYSLTSFNMSHEPIVPFEKMASNDLVYLANPSVPDRIKDPALRYFLEGRPLNFIQKAQDEVSRRFILDTRGNGLLEEVMLDILRDCGQMRTETKLLAETSVNKRLPLNITGLMKSFIGKSPKTSPKGRKTCRRRRNRATRRRRN